MCTHNQCFDQNEKNIIIFHLEIEIIKAVIYCCILHGRVCVMGGILWRFVSDFYIISVILIKSVF